MSNLKNRLKGIKNMSKKDRFWKLAVYHTDRLEGGSEEGGWYYTAGDRVKEGKIKFTDPKKALRACRLFNKLYGKRINSYQYGVEAEVYFRGSPKEFPKYPPNYS
jgi:hypothetical protein